MASPGNPNSYYIGQECYKPVEKLISDGKEVLIVSPYMDSYYAKFLIEKASGRKIRIISSSMDSEAMKILKRKRPLGPLLAGLVIILSLDYLAYTVGKFSFGFGFLSLLLVISCLLIFKFKKYEVEVKIPREFVHAKMYINEREAIHGSANLTYNGMHKNVEHIEVTREKERVEKLREEFFRLWN
jgi:phosphatidylserine/phosphatidylglycerophosphate/cardiolipin synthase-like enzyme